MCDEEEETKIWLILAVIVVAVVVCVYYLICTLSYFINIVTQMNEETRRVSAVIKSLDALGKAIRRTEPCSPDNTLKHM